MEARGPAQPGFRPAKGRFASQPPGGGATFP